MAESSATSGADQAIRVVLPHAYAEVAGAILMELLGPFELQVIADADDGAAIPAAGGSLAEHAGEMAALVFYPAADTRSSAAGRSVSGQVPLSMTSWPRFQRRCALQETCGCRATMYLETGWRGGGTTFGPF